MTHALSLLLWLAPPASAEPDVPVVTVQPDRQDVEPLQPTEVPLPEMAERVGVSWPLTDVSLRVDKSDRHLTVYSGETPVKTYLVGLGGAPAGDKVRLGDQKTPVGEFTIVTRNPNSNFHLFLGVSYPMAEDADRGLQAGLIDENQAAAIRAAEANGIAPPWNTTLGGLIGIHGGGSGVDWTLGCIAVEDHEIEELWAVVPKRTKLTISE